MSTTATTAPGALEPNPIAANPAAKLSREAVIWLAVISALVAIAFITILILLCRCSLTKRTKKARSRQSHRYSGSVSDDRLSYYAYNRSAVLGGDQFDGLDCVGGRYGDHATAHATQLPVAMEKVRINERLSHRLRDERAEEPVVMEEGHAVAVSVRRGTLGAGQRAHRETGRHRGSRYYSGWGLKRLIRGSQIGKAF